MHAYPYVLHSVYIVYIIMRLFFSLWLCLGRKTQSVDTEYETFFHDHVVFCQHSVVFASEYAKCVVICDIPVYELVLLQILAALSNVSGHVQKVHHGQARWVLLIKQTKDAEVH